MAEVNDIKDVAMALAKKQRLFKERQRNKLTNEIDTLINDLNELSKNPSANFYTVKFILENDLKIYYVSNYPKDKRVIRHGRRKFFYNA